MSTALPLYVKLELRAMTNRDFDRDSPVMMSSAMPSAKYSCSGSELRLVKERIAIEGLSGSARAGFGGSIGLPAGAAAAGPCASRPSPPKRKPLAGRGLMEGRSPAESPDATLADFRRGVQAPI